MDGVNNVSFLGRGKSRENNLIKNPWKWKNERINSMFEELHLNPFIICRFASTKFFKILYLCHLYKIIN